jgi:hypothetical protein
MLGRGSLGPQQWKESFIIPIYKNGDKTDYSNYRVISLLLTIYKMLFNIPFSTLTPYIKDQLLIRYSAFIRFWEYIFNGTVHELFVDFKKTFDSVRRDVFVSYTVFSLYLVYL